eukprot:10220614-Alexandrium_andersonii.AAC.2
MSRMTTTPATPCLPERPVAVRPCTDGHMSRSGDPTASAIPVTAPPGKPARRGGDPPASAIPDTGEPPPLP